MTKIWLQTEAPSYRQAMAIIEDIPAMERLTYKLKMKKRALQKGGENSFHLKQKRTQIELYLKRWGLFPAHKPFLCFSIILCGETWLFT